MEANINAALMHVINMSDGSVDIEKVIQSSPDAFDLCLGKLNKKFMGATPGLTIIGARPSAGKCLGFGTKVIMYDGSKKEVQDIVMGDLIMGPDSEAKRVKSTCVGKSRMYWIKQNKGINYRVNADHILSLKRSKTEGKHKHGDILNISAIDYLNKSVSWKGRYKGYRSEAISFPLSKTSKWEIDPYIFGTWLADGSKKGGVIYTPDEEVVAEIKEYCLRSDFKFKAEFKKGCYYCRIARKNHSDYSFTEMLRHIGVYRNKHVPNVYKFASVEDRLQLLAGFLDGDGSLCKKGSRTFEVTQKRLDLLQGIKEIADSLGFRCSISEKIGRIKSIGFVGKYYRAFISGNISDIPNRVPRKQAKEWSSIRSWNQTGITIVPDGIGTYYGFELENAIEDDGECDGLFLLEDYTVTHNTSVAIQSIVSNALMGKRVLFFSMETIPALLYQKMLVYLTKIPLKKIMPLKQGWGAVDQVHHQNLKSAIAEMSALPIHVDFRNKLVPKDIMDVYEGLVAQGQKPEAIYLDYLQYMAPGEDRVLITNISKALTDWAKDNNIPIIALAQLGRKSVEDELKRPSLVDLKGSGSIEQDAENVILLYRQDYLKERNGKLDDLDGVIEFIVSKQKLGGTGIVEAHWTGETYTCDFSVTRVPGSDPNGSSIWVSDLELANRVSSMIGDSEEGEV